MYRTAPAELLLLPEIKIVRAMTFSPEGVRQTAMCLLWLFSRAET